MSRVRFLPGPLRFSVILIALSLLGCGGGGGGDSSDGMVLEGTLVQGSGVHERILPKHGAGDPIDEVEICALGSCSRTDALGHWGFLVEGEFAGGDVAISVVGHFIDTTTIVNIPAGAKDVSMELVNNEGTVTAHTVTVDGAESPHEHEEGEGEHSHE